MEKIYEYIIMILIFIAVIMICKVVNRFIKNAIDRFSKRK